MRHSYQLSLDTFFRRKPLILLTRHERWRSVAKTLQLSPKARQRLEWFIYYETKGGQNVLRTCRYFGIAPKTFYKWRHRFTEANLRLLEEHDRAPKRRRSRMITPVQEERIVALKRSHIRWGKEKIAAVYTTTYGEPVSSWKAQKVIEKHRLYYHLAKQARINRKRRRSVKRKRITELKTRPMSGFLLCVDTIVLYWNGTKRYIFTAIDKHTKIAFARMYTTKSSVNARDFLYRLHYVLNGQIQNAGHDNGSEFRGAFAHACADLGIEQYVSRLRTPKDNATNERFNRTLQEEFVQLGNFTAETQTFNRNLTEWLIVYNFIRPHQTLGYQTPMHFISKHRQLLPMYPSRTIS